MVVEYSLKYDFQDDHLLKLNSKIDVCTMFLGFVTAMVTLFQENIKHAFLVDSDHGMSRKEQDGGHSFMVRC